MESQGRQLHKGRHGAEEGETRGGVGGARGCHREIRQREGTGFKFNSKSPSACRGDEDEA